ncbi:hypothetical protein SDC9_110347 [bioreactor metagenome]|uniref:Uncharacterized protein n=1 Tax=bioreactor metagenome TaxID=1076179 RepID=A0A645BDQ2_9ZZZZ
MDLGRAGLAQHPDQRPLGVAAHDRVVDDDQALALDHVAQRVELQPDAELADGLGRLDERTSHVVVLDQALGVADAGFLGVADRGGHTGGRHRHHQVGLDRVLAGQRPADLDPGGVHRAAEDGGVGAGDVDVLEDAALPPDVGEPGRAQAVGIDRDALPRLDLADERGADDVQGTGLRRDDPAALETAQAQRPEALRVTGRVERLLVHEHQRERPPQVRQDLQRRGPQRLVVEGGDQGRQDRGVVGGIHRVLVRHLLGGAALVQPALEVVGVDEVAVVGEGDAVRRGGAKGGLGVAPDAGTGRGVAGVADGEVTGQRVQGALVEHLRDQAHVLEHHDPLAVRDGDAGRFLAAVLQGVEAVVGELGHVLPRRPHAEHAALILRGLLQGVELGGQPAIGAWHLVSLTARPGSSTRVHRT